MLGHAEVKREDDRQNGGAVGERDVSVQKAHHALID